eukprot:3369044-Prymnesium_polylepis.1
MDLRLERALALQLLSLVSPVTSERRTALHGAAILYREAGAWFHEEACERCGAALRRREDEERSEKKKNSGSPLSAGSRRLLSQLSAWRGGGGGGAGSGGGG